MELRTQVLMATQWEHELVVSYGWGCDLDMDDLYQEVPLPLLGLREWVVQASVSGIFTLGEGTLHIRSKDKEIEFELRHEADIHVTTKSKELAQEIVAGWAANGLTSYEVGQTQ